MGESVLTCDAVLFDMDGTLVDSTACVVRQWTLWARQHGLDVAQILEVSHGRRTIETMRDVAPHLAIEEEAARFEENELNDREGILAIQGAQALLNRMPPAQWAVVTSASRALATVRLECAGLPVPPVLISSGDVERGKPDPEGYLLAAHRLGVAARRCLVIEDTPAGLEAARAAGMEVLAVTTTYSCQDLSDAPCIPDFTRVHIVNGSPSRELRITIRR
jgi:sugar-phosphatase